MSLTLTIACPSNESMIRLASHGELGSVAPRTFSSLICRLYDVCLIASM